MKPTERTAFGQLVTNVYAYYRQDCTPFVLDVWWAACQGFDLEQVQKAMTSHATDPEAGRFCPKVADIVKALAGTTTDRAAIAWGKVHEAMSSVGAYSDVVFDDPAIHATVADCGGWPKMCRTELKELSYLQHRFTTAYRAYAGRGEFDYPRRLGGDRSPDSDYERKGIPLPRPAIVGDPDTAKRVYQGGGAGKTLITYATFDSLAAPAQALIASKETT